MRHPCGERPATDLAHDPISEDPMSASNPYDPSTAQSYLDKRPEDAGLTEGWISPDDIKAPTRRSTPTSGPLTSSWTKSLRY